MRLVQALTAQKADGEACEAAKEAYAKNPSSGAFLEEYVSELCYLKRFDEAAAACRAFLATNADSETGHLTLAQVLFEGGDAPQAQESLQAAEQAAKNPKLFLMRATNLCSLVGDHDRAVAYATRLAEQSPGDLSAVLLQADALVKVGRKKDAVQVVSVALQRNPDSEPFLRKAVGILAAAKQDGQAAALCAEFLKRRPENVQISAMYIELLARTGKLDEALAETKRLESVAGPKAAPDVTASLMRAYEMLGELRAAERLGLRLCEQTPEDAQAWIACASIMEEQGAPGRLRAIPLYRKALSLPLASHFAKALLINNLVYALAESSFPTAAEKDRALAEAELLADGILGDRETVPGFLLDTAGWVKFARNKFEEAHQLLALATSRSDASAEMWCHYAMSCAATGRTNAAAEAVGKAVQMDPKSTQWMGKVIEEIARNQKKP
jgi:tetratricopeptide (TPR) repeat protein